MLSDSLFFFDSCFFLNLALDDIGDHGLDSGSLGTFQYRAGAESLDKFLWAEDADFKAWLGVRSSDST